MLARLDSNQMASVSSTTDADTITESALSPLRTIAEARQVEVKTTVFSETQLHLPVELVTFALRNVVKNAIQFSALDQQATICSGSLISDTIFGGNMTFEELFNEMYIIAGLCCTLWPCQ